MEVTIKLSLEEGQLIQDRATASGEDVTSYLERLVHRHLETPSVLAEILEPIRREFAESGMGDEELDVLVEEAREEVWRMKRRADEAESRGLDVP